MKSGENRRWKVFGGTVTYYIVETEIANTLWCWGYNINVDTEYNGKNGSEMCYYKIIDDSFLWIFLGEEILFRIISKGLILTLFEAT